MANIKNIGGKQQCILELLRHNLQKHTLYEVHELFLAIGKNRSQVGVRRKTQEKPGGSVSVI